MFETLSLGVLSSLAAELITWLNSKLSGTVLKGDGAFLVSAVVALIISAVEVFHTGVSVTNLDQLWSVFTQVWAISQVTFLVVIQTLGIDVSSTPTVEDSK